MVGSGKTRVAFCNTSLIPRLRSRGGGGAGYEAICNTCMLHTRSKCVCIGYTSAHEHINYASGCVSVPSHDIVAVILLQMGL